MSITKIPVIPIKMYNSIIYKSVISKLVEGNPDFLLTNPFGPPAGDRRLQAAGESRRTRWRTGTVAIGVRQVYNTWHAASRFPAGTRLSGAKPADCRIAGPRSRLL